MRAKEFIIESKVDELSPALMQRAADKLQDRINRSSNLDDEDKLIARQVRMSHKARKNEKGDLYKKKEEDIEEAKKNRRDVKHSVKPKAPNPVAKHAMSTIGGGGFGAHKDKKKAEKQGDVKHKARQYEEGVEEATKKPNATTRHLKDYPVSDKDVAKPVKKPEKKKPEQGVAEGFGPLPKDNQQIRLGRHTVEIERVGKHNNYIGFAWNDSKGKEHYEEVPVGDLGSYDDLIDRIKDEIRYQERQYTDRGVA